MRLLIIISVSVFATTVKALSIDDFEKRIAKLEDALKLQEQRHVVEITRVKDELEHWQSYVGDIERRLLEVVASKDGQHVTGL